ncbi:hypothetical protein PHMEG_00026762 [Phytophthora megakarya]|uniref:Uncharacterized protein n=1 Tax=Phytophthora megakarya TaxID=4795 RepID=A0A225VA82_9STRA|nr:hypothetical protein PHMEG_00026762 [Phytophthora megakarya]
MIRAYPPPRCTAFARRYSTHDLRSIFTIRKHLKLDLYYVELSRLLSDVPDREIYDWFLDRGVRPVLITPTFVSGVLKSRDRIVYFNDTAWPSKNFLDNDKARRETTSVTPGSRALFNIPIAS